MSKPALMLAELDCAASSWPVDTKQQLLVDCPPHLHLPLGHLMLSALLSGQYVGPRHHQHAYTVQLYVCQETGSITLHAACLSPTCTLARQLARRCDHQHSRSKQLRACASDATHMNVMLCMSGLDPA